MGATASIALTGFQALSAVKGAKDKSDAIQEQARYQNQIMQLNNKIADAQASEAITKGDQEANALRTKVSQIVGAQKVAFAANGVDVSSGSALKTQEDTHTLGELDAIKIKNNAWREAWGYKMQATSNSLQGSLTNAAAQNTARSTLATGGLNALNYAAKGYSLAKGYFGGGGGSSSTDLQAGDAVDLSNIA